MHTLSLRRAIHALFRSPFVTIIAIASLALGIGANAAIFSLFEQFLLRPLPVPEPARLDLAAPGPKPGSQSCNDAGGCEGVFSYLMFRDLQREQTPFIDIAAHRSFGANLSYRGETVSGRGMLVSGSYFPVLGGRAARSLLFELQDNDPMVLFGSAVALTVVALGAGAVPAWRASRIEPMIALRHE